MTKGKFIPTTKEFREYRGYEALLKNADIFGYNEFTLKAYMQIAGRNPTVAEVGRLINRSPAAAYKRMLTGEFTRNEIQKIAIALELTPEQLCAIFFTGKEGKVHEKITHKSRNIMEENK